MEIMPAFRATLIDLLLLALLIPGGQELYMVELQLYSYQNNDHVLRNGYCCDSPGKTDCTGHCDNYFIFWEGNTTTSPVYRTEVYLLAGDFIDFTSSPVVPLVGGSSASNPLNFTVDPDMWQGVYHLYIGVRDYDGKDDPPDVVDDIHISIPLSLTPIFTDLVTDKGQNMIQNFYFVYAYRVSCAEYYYYNGHDCSVYCQPRDDEELGHYTCSEEGMKLCREGYTDPLTNCTKCYAGAECSDMVEELQISTRASDSVRGTLNISLQPTSSSLSTPTPKIETPHSHSNEQESLPLTVIGAGIGGALVIIAVIVTVLVTFVCIIKRKRDNCATPHVATEMTENEAYGKRSEVSSNDHNVYVGTRAVFSLYYNEAYGATNVDDGGYENYDYPRV